MEAIAGNKLTNSTCAYRLKWSLDIRRQFALALLANFEEDNGIVCKFKSDEPFPAQPPHFGQSPPT